MNRDLLENVFVTAIEGGSNYWYMISGKNRRKVREKVPTKVDPCFSTALLSAVIDHEVEVDFHDQEDPQTEIGTLSLKTMEERLEKLRADESYKWALEAEEEENGDAESSDIVFQYLVMGEVVYA